MPSRLRIPQRWSEAALAVLFAGLAVGELAIHGELHSAAQGLLAVLVALPVAIRFRAPLLALGASAAFSVAEGLHVRNEGQVLMPTVCLLFELYAVGSRYRGWRFWAGGLIVATCIALTLVLREGVNSDLALAVLLPGAGLLLGRASGVLLLETEVLEGRTKLLEQERDEHVRVALAQERRRIARELHDVVGQSISVMGVQAGAVRTVLAPDQMREREALIAVERVGREAVAEMRRLVGLLRTEDDEDLVAVPSLERLDALVSDMRSAGQDLDLEVEGDISQLPPGVDLAGYRILQEALTNALKHAPSAHVSARVSHVNGSLSLEVVDEGQATQEPAVTGHVGHGLIGMRERATIYGGTLQAEPRRDRPGFSVCATLPAGPR